MDTLRSMVWKRLARVRLRPASAADREGLRWLSAQAPRRLATLEAWPEPAAMQRLLGAGGPGQLAIECDQRLIGASLGYWTHTGPAQAAQPWGALAADGPAALDAALDTPAGWLRGAGIFWLDEPCWGPVGSVVHRARLALVQQLGLPGTYSVIDAVDYPQAGSSMSPSAYLQQVHARSIEDRRLSAFLRAGYQMRGFYRHPIAPRVVMIWKSRPR
jgi:hypothetical protein